MVKHKREYNEIAITWKPVAAVIGKRRRKAENGVIFKQPPLSGNAVLQFSCNDISIVTNFASNDVVFRLPSI